MILTFDKEILEQSCKEIIETILVCLPNAFKGTVYRIGLPPRMIAQRVSSGIIENDRKTISWGLPQRSDYNPPGKSWNEYMDKPGRPLEAMAWCVERQRSWTAEDSQTDARSVRLQVEGVSEDVYHMEPVLIRKEDLLFGNGAHIEYAKNIQGETLWKDSDYVVVAIIKIHFLHNTIKIAGPQTRTIKKLSRALGTELMSYQLKKQSYEDKRQLAEDKLNSCNILADSLRNTISKSGLIFSLIKLELGVLRRQWEIVLLELSDKKDMKREAVETLNQILNQMYEECGKLGKNLITLQNKFINLSLPPEGGLNWIRMQIENKWNQLFNEVPFDDEQIGEIRSSLDHLKSSLFIGSDPDLLARYNRIPESLKMEWIDLIYKDIQSLDFQYLNRLTSILENPSLNLPYQEKTRKSLLYLKALAEIMGQLENNTNIVLREVLNGDYVDTFPNVLNKIAV